MASIELEGSIKQALKQLHSNGRDSTEQVRLLLDELIRQGCGSSKTMGNVLPKKYLAEERKKEPPPPPPKKREENSPQRIQIEAEAEGDGDAELTFELLDDDLTCAVCGQIAVQAGNRLVECFGCHALYHQDCHKPVVRDTEVGAEWQCAACLKPKPSVSSKKAVVPNINIISADKRLQIMKKKAAKQQENKRKHSK